MQLGTNSSLLEKNGPSFHWRDRKMLFFFFSHSLSPQLLLSDGCRNFGDRGPGVASHREEKCLISTCSWENFSISSLFPRPFSKPAYRLCPLFLFLVCINYYFFTQKVSSATTWVLVGTERGKGRYILSMKDVSNSLFLPFFHSGEKTGCYWYLSLLLSNKAFPGRQRWIYSYLLPSTVWKNFAEAY